MAFNRWLLALVIFLTIYVYTNMHTSYYESVSCWSCSTLWTWTCDPMDCSLPGSSVHSLLQARILEWLAIPFSRGSSQPRDQTWVSCIAGIFFAIWATRKPPATGWSWLSDPDHSWQSPHFRKALLANTKYIQILETFNKSKTYNFHLWIHSP